MTTFYLIRHAEHCVGPEVHTGRMPGVHLSEKGRAQAADLAARLQDVPLKAIYSSPLERTCETAEAVGSALGIPIQCFQELNEIDVGDWTGVRFDDLKQLEQWQRFNEFRSGTRAPNGELMLETQSRIVCLMHDLRSRHPDESVALVSHGEVIKSAILYFLGMPLDFFLRLEIGHASVSIVEVADWGPKVVCVNSTGSFA